MTISTATDRWDYAGSGTTGPFNVTRKIQADTDLVVRKLDSTTRALLATLLLGTDYSVTNVGNDNGAQVATTVAVPVGQLLQIIDLPALTQPTDFKNQGDFLPKRHEDSYDRLARQILWLQDQLNRAIKVTSLESTSIGALANVTDRQGKFLAFDASGNPAPSVGIGSDPNLRTDLANGGSGPGSDLVAVRRTAAEIAAGVTPINYQYQPGDSRRYNVLSDGATNNATALQNCLNAIAGTGLKAVINLLGGSAAINVGSTVTLASNTEIEVARGVSIVSTLAGGAILKGDDVSNISITGGTWTGKDNTTAIDGGNGGLIYIDNIGTANGNIHIRNAVVNKSGTAGISVLHASSLWVQDCEVFDTKVYGILASLSSNFHIDGNYCHDSAEAGASNTYGIMATGSNATGSPSERCSISFNKIRNYVSWDGIMSHDATRLIVAFNVIDNVRIGIDISAASGTNIFEDVTVVGNQINLTSTNNWGATPANHCGIIVLGHTAGANAARVVVANNSVNGFNVMAGATYSGNPAPINVGYADNVSIVGNVIDGVDNISAGGVGIYLVGRLNTACIANNAMSGDMTAGGIRFATVSVSDTVSIIGNCIVQDAVGSPAVQFTGSTISKLSLGHNTTNSTVPLSVTTSTVTYEGEGSFTGTLTGCTTSPTGTIAYKINYETRIVTVVVPIISATSNTTACTITGMPVVCRPANTQVVTAVSTDNGVDVVSRWSIAATGVITLNNGTGVFTNAGTKGSAACTFTFAMT